MTTNNSNSNGNPLAKQSWTAAGLSQHDLMQADTVLVVDSNDVVIGSASKQDSHVFSPSQPYGVLHRAFSVFLFDRKEGRLLLQQRASDKITFPNVWTNTCCSHPLHGMTPSEVDEPHDVADGSVRGVKHAAIRKLQHELGLSVPFHSLKFLTRVHYWAADTITHGPQAPWGEHEIDYVLFGLVEDEHIPIHPNPDEVGNTKWVSPEELQTMLNDSSLLFSPWFRLICTKWLFTQWWKDLAITMNTQQYCDYTTIHKFDPPMEHVGGAGNAKPMFLAVVGDTSKKQGAYGKIPTHSDPKWLQLMHLDEVFAAMSLLYLQPLVSNLSSESIRTRYPTEALQVCDEILVHVSRSFAAVIRQLPATLLVDIMIFYLVLRALDTIEDDTTAFASNAIKVEHLKSFHKQALVDPTWKMEGVGEGEERRLLEEFPKAHEVYASLPAVSKRIIADITQRMAMGMAEFVDKDLGQGTKDIDQYNRYCHFVAGLVGEGLSRLFAASGLEKASFSSELHLSDQMGLFLQKTNIIRDYLEDYVDKRAFWPQSVWKKYSATGELGYFASNPKDPMVRTRALACLNELITDALELVPYCLLYLSKLQCQEIFRFCAIPQVMAIATLDKCYANPNVFTGVVKIRKGLSCKLILRTNTLAQVHETFYDFAKSIQDKVMAERRGGMVDPNYSRTLRACETILDLTRDGAARTWRARMMRQVGIVIVMSSAVFLSRCVAEPMSPLALALTGLLCVAGYVVSQGPWMPRSSLTEAELLERK